MSLLFNTKSTKLRRLGMATAMVVALVSGASSANAASVTGSFNLRGSGGPQDFPNFILSNTSDAGVEITHFNMTIGDDDFNFDRFYQHNNTGFFTPSNPGSGNAPTYNLDTVDDGTRFDEIDIGYSGFVAGAESNFRVEFDPDDFNANVDPRTVLFNNGASVANSLITVAFMFDGVEGLAELTLPDVTGSAATAFIYNFTGSVEFETSAISAVPLPASLPLFGAGLAVLGLASWRRKKKSSA